MNDRPRELALFMMDRVAKEKKEGKEKKSGCLAYLYVQRSIHRNPSFNRDPSVVSYDSAPFDLSESFDPNKNFI